jgi:hypothetical protein
MFARPMLVTAALAAFLSVGSGIARAGAATDLCPHFTQSNGLFSAPTAALTNGLTSAQTIIALAQDGIALTSDPASSVRLIDYHQLDGGFAVGTGSQLESAGLYNLLVQSSDNPASFTMTFLAPVNSFVFLRANLSGGPDGVSQAAWSATAYTSDGAKVATVSELEIHTTSDIIEQIFLLRGASKIKSVVFRSQNHKDTFANVVIASLGWCP